VLGFAATKPGEFRLRRTHRINTAPAKIFPFINDFRRWEAWSPWEKLDPALKRTHSGAASGKGAVYEWEGNGKAGKGRMEIVDSAAPGKLTIKIDFIKPFEAHNTVEFMLEPKANATDVTWSMFGPNPYMMKVMGVFVDMDKMVGKDFETGLANLKAVAET
jgi:hypothetical protein